MHFKTWFRLFLLVVLILFITYHFIPSVEIWCNDRYQRMREKWVMWNEFVQDKTYDVPESDRKPAVASLSDFYRQRDQTLFDQYLATHAKFPEQHSVGSVMQDGGHIVLPPNMRWHNGKIDILEIERA